jgi:hypothetical protein
LSGEFGSCQLNSDHVRWIRIISGEFGSQACKLVDLAQQNITVMCKIKDQTAIRFPLSGEFGSCQLNSDHVRWIRIISGEFGSQACKLANSAQKNAVLLANQRSNCNKISTVGWIRIMSGEFGSQACKLADSAQKTQCYLQNQRANCNRISIVRWIQIKSM